MSRYVNISELADQVLASVTSDVNTKTASAHTPTRTYAPGVSELKKLAADLREAGPEDDVSDEDLMALMQDPEVAQLLEAIQNDPELMQMLMQHEEMGDHAAPEMPAAEALPPEAEAEAENKPAPNMPPVEKAAEAIRKIAAQLKSDAIHSKHVRLVKAAHMVNAATGLQHLTEGFK